ncbi:MAG: hypothetical protein ABIW79_08470, partial [Gemmatimonas sp.]
RAAAAGRITPDAVLDVSRSVDVPVAEAWLNETGQTFDVDARTLVRLADAGLPPRMIDLLVALSYPQTFAVRRSLSRGANSRAPGVEWHESTLSTSSVFQVMCAGVPASFGQLGQDDCYSRSRYGSMYDPFGYGYGYSSRSGYGYGNGYGSRYGNGYYYGSQPIIIIDRGSGTGAAAQNSGARAVNGRGYTRDTRPDPTSTSGTSRSGSSGSSATPASSGSSGSGSGSSGESSSGGRTAKARGGSQ